MKELDESARVRETPQHGWRFGGLSPDDRAKHLQGLRELYRAELHNRTNALSPVSLLLDTIFEILLSTLRGEEHTKTSSRLLSECGLGDIVMEFRQQLRTEQIPKKLTDEHMVLLRELMESKVFFILEAFK